MLPVLDLGVSQTEQLRKLSLPLIVLWLYRLSSHYLEAVLLE
jgi:predicted double-glycine peptidase